MFTCTILRSSLHVKKKNRVFFTLFFKCRAFANLPAGRQELRQEVQAIVKDVGTILQKHDNPRAPDPNSMPPKLLLRQNPTQATF